MNRMRDSGKHGEKADADAAGDHLTPLSWLKYAIPVPVFEVNILGTLGSQAGWIPCGFSAEGKGANVLTSFFSPRPSQSKHTHVKFSSVVWLVFHGLSRSPVLSGFSPEINLLGILFNQELLEERPGYGYDRNQTSSAFPGAERGKNFPSRISSQGITERPRVIEQQQRPEENSEAFFRTFRKACFQSHRS